MLVRVAEFFDISRANVTQASRVSLISFFYVISMDFDKYGLIHPRDMLRAVQSTQGTSFIR